MPFRGWSTEAIEFFEGLEADNSKLYWETHRDTYERGVRAPMEQLLTELEGEFGGGRIFRPYRDVRFSTDKSPYKTNIAAMVGDMGYLSVDATGLGVGCGLFHMTPDQLARYREAVVADATGTSRWPRLSGGRVLSLTGSSIRSRTRNRPKRGWILVREAAC